MKICLINNLYKPYARGGAEKVVDIIAQGLIKSGQEVFIITTRPWLKPRPSGKGELPMYYFKSLYHNLNKFPKGLRLFWHIWNIFNVISFFKIKKILKREKCQAVITNNLMGLGLLTPLAIRRLKIRHLHVVHDIQLIHPSGLLRFGRERLLDGYFSGNYAGLVSQLFGSPQAVIFPSRWLRDRYLDKIFFIKSKRIVLPNPVESAPIAAAPAQTTRTGKAENGEVFKFLYLGQMEKHKGPDLLIQAFKKIKEKFPRAELIFAGDGSAFGYLKTQAAADKSIKFLGWPGEAAADELLAASDSLVYPSLVYENCPNAIERALNAGLPVIAADLGGISELIEENITGLLFRPGNAADLAEKMAWAIEHKDELDQMARTGREKAKQYGVENYIKELEKILA